MSEAGRDRRKRAVRLTEDALAILNNHLMSVSRKAGETGRITKSAQARLMEVSPKTADKVLGRLGNDRSVLVEIFARLGLEWHESYCEYLDGSVTEPIADASPDAPRTPARPMGLLALAAVLVVALALTLASVNAGKAQPAEDSVIAGLAQMAETLEEARGAYNRADFDAAATLAARSRELAKRHARADAMAEAVRLEGEILAARGDLDGAIALYQEALPLWSAFGIALGRYSLLEVWGTAEWRRGNRERAVELLEESLSGLQQVGDPGGVAGVSRTLGAIAAEQGDRRSAREWYARAKKAIADRPDEPMHTDLRAREALLLRDEGDFAGALGLLEVCLREWEAREHPRWIAATCVQMATVHQAAGEGEKARPLLKEARELYEQVGDQAGVERCDELLGPSGANASQ